MLKQLLRPTNRRSRILLGILLAGLFCIQCTQQTQAVRETGYTVSLDVEATSDLDKKLEDLAKSDHVALLEMCLKNYDESYKDYTCTFIKQEVIRGAMKLEQKVDVKFMDAPFSVAMKWTKNPGPGDRVLFVEGKNDDKMVVRPTSSFLRALVGGTVKRKPDDPQAMQNTLRPVSMFGFKRGMANLLKVYRKAKAAGDLKEDFGGYMDVAGRKTLVLVRYLPAKSNYSTHKTEIFIDVERLVPVCIKGYDWDNKLESKYIYKDVKFNVGLAANDFTTKANGM